MSVAMAVAGVRRSRASPGLWASAQAAAALVGGQRAAGGHPDRRCRSGIPTDSVWNSISGRPVAKVLSVGAQPQERALQTHYPKISEGPDRTWVVDCAQCRNDTQSGLPIGIGMPLRDRDTAERLRDNHASRSARVVAS